MRTSLNTCACNNYAQFCQHQSRQESLKQLCEVGVGSIAALIHHCVHSNNILILKTSPEATSQSKEEGRAIKLHLWLLVSPYEVANLVNLYRDHQQAFCFPRLLLNHVTPLKDFSFLLSNNSVKRFLCKQGDWGTVFQLLTFLSLVSSMLQLAAALATCWCASSLAK